MLKAHSPNAPFVQIVTSACPGPNGNPIVIVLALDKEGNAWKLKGNAWVSIPGDRIITTESDARDEDKPSILLN